MDEPSASHVSLAAGLDAPGVQAAPYDPDAPSGDLHESHGFEAFDRWCECAACGVRDYWPGACSPCPGILPEDKKGRKVPPRPVTLAEALVILRADLEQFGAWCEQKGQDYDRPDMPEWCGEFLCWTHDRGGRL